MSDADGWIDLEWLGGPYDGQRFKVRDASTVIIALETYRPQQWKPPQPIDELTEEDIMHGADVVQIEVRDGKAIWPKEGEDT